MPLVNDQSASETPEQKLANETRARLTEYTQSTLLVYGNLMNYRHNNAQGVTKAQLDKALGADAKDFDYVLPAMKRLLLRLNPNLKAQLDEMAPKAKKAAK
jgi:hypothetical protein